MPRVKKKANKKNKIEPVRWTKTDLSRSLTAYGGWGSAPKSTFSFFLGFKIGNDEPRKVKVVLKPSHAWKYHDNPTKIPDAADFFWWVEERKNHKNESRYTNYNDFNCRIDGVGFKPLFGWLAEKQKMIKNEGIKWALTEWARRKAWL